MQILFENDRYIIVNKPAGLLVHPDGKGEEETLCDWIMDKYPEIEGVGEDFTPTDGPTIKRPGIVHRLDRDTSGALVIAKTQEAFMYLKAQFQDREVEKIYHTFVYGNIKEDSGVVDKEIGKSRKSFGLWSAGSNARGTLREAVTEYSVLKRGKDGDEHYCFLEVRPKTGRTHQIRVHMKAIEHPVVCDPLYAPKRACILGFDRLALHARQISFVDMNGEEVVVEASYPEDFEKTFAL